MLPTSRGALSAQAFLTGGDGASTYVGGGVAYNNTSGEASLNVGAVGGAAGHLLLVQVYTPGTGNNATISGASSDSYTWSGAGYKTVWLSIVLSSSSPVLVTGMGTTAAQFGIVWEIFSGPTVATRVSTTEATPDGATTLNVTGFVKSGTIAVAAFLADRQNDLTPAIASPFTLRNQAMPGNGSPDGSFGSSISADCVAALYVNSSVVTWSNLAINGAGRVGVLFSLT